MMAIVCLNGRYLDEKKAFISVKDAGFYYGEGFYETLRTREGQLLNVEGHLRRLRRSAEIVGVPLPAAKTISTWLFKTVEKNGFWEKGKESRVRLTVSGGVHGFDEPATKPTILITAYPLHEVSRSQRMRGVSAVTYRAERPIPEAKTTNLLPSMIARRYMRSKRAYEVFFVDHRGFITEGSISNVFLVQRGRMITPKTSLLAGTTRERIFELAQKYKWKIVERDVRLQDLYAAAEIFFTNAPRGVVPVVKVDGRVIGDGKVGEITKRVWAGLKAESN